MRLLMVGMLALIVLLQYRIWVDENGLAGVWRLESAVAAQRAENARFARENERVAAEVRDLRDGLDAVEARARRDLGMIRADETLYRFAHR